MEMFGVSVASTGRSRFRGGRCCCWVLDHVRISYNGSPQPRHESEPGKPRRLKPAARYKKNEPALLDVMWSWVAGLTVLRLIEGDERGGIEGLFIHSDVRRSRFG